MKLGVQIRPTDYSLDPREIGRMVEAHGFESLFFPEHTHIPLATRSLEPDDPDWLETCMHMLDPFVALATVATVTERLRLGTGVSLIVEHDPITLAKEVATLDLLSAGRFLFGVGAGWNRAEMIDHGVDPTQRWELLREHVLAMKVLWMEEQAEFHGRFVDFGPAFQWPKPSRKPHLPILIGGEGPGVLDRVLDYGDGWMPNEHRGVDARVIELRQRLTELGRDPLPVTIYSVAWDRSAVERYLAIGVERCVFTIPAFDATGIERGLRDLWILVGDLASGIE
jgi:probable F420-dependent oxidoreductase